VNASPTCNPTTHSPYFYEYKAPEATQVNLLEAPAFMQSLDLPRQSSNVCDDLPLSMGAPPSSVRHSKYVMAQPRAPLLFSKCYVEAKALSDENHLSAPLSKRHTPPPKLQINKSLDQCRSQKSTPPAPSISPEPSRPHSIRSSRAAVKNNAVRFRSQSKDPCRSLSVDQDSPLFIRPRCSSTTSRSSVSSSLSLCSIRSYDAPDSSQNFRSPDMNDVDFQHVHYLNEGLRRNSFLREDLLQRPVIRFIEDYPHDQFFKTKGPALREHPKLYHEVGAWFEQSEKKLDIDIHHAKRCMEQARCIYEHKGEEHSDYSKVCREFWKVLGFSHGDIAKLLGSAMLEGAIDFNSRILRLPFVFIPDWLKDTLITSLINQLPSVSHTIAATATDPIASVLRQYFAFGGRFQWPSWMPKMTHQEERRTNKIIEILAQEILYRYQQGENISELLPRVDELVQEAIQKHSTLVGFRDIKNIGELGQFISISAQWICKAVFLPSGPLSWILEGVADMTTEGVYLLISPIVQVCSALVMERNLAKYFWRYLDWDHEAHLKEQLQEVYISGAKLKSDLLEQALKSQLSEKYEIYHQRQLHLDYLDKILFDNITDFKIREKLAEYSLRQIHHDLRFVYRYLIEQVLYPRVLLISFDAPLLNPPLRGQIEQLERKLLSLRNQRHYHQPYTLANLIHSIFADKELLYCLGWQGQHEEEFVTVQAHSFYELLEQKRAIGHWHLTPESIVTEEQYFLFKRIKYLEGLIDFASNNLRQFMQEEFKYELLGLKTRNKVFSDHPSPSYESSIKNPYELIEWYEKLCHHQSAFKRKSKNYADSLKRSLQQHADLRDQLYQLGKNIVHTYEGQKDIQPPPHLSLELLNKLRQDRYRMLIQQTKLALELEQLSADFYFLQKKDYGSLRLNGKIVACVKYRGKLLWEALKHRYCDSSAFADTITRNIILGLLKVPGIPGLYITGKSFLQGKETFASHPTLSLAEFSLGAAIPTAPYDSTRHHGRQSLKVSLAYSAQGFAFTSLNNLYETGADITGRLMEPSAHIHSLKKLAKSYEPLKKEMPFEPLASERMANTFFYPFGKF
jgi:hypothetical protein